MKNISNLSSNNVMNIIDAATWTFHIEEGYFEVDENWLSTIGFGGDKINQLNLESWHSYIHPDQLFNVIDELNKVVSGFKSKFNITYKIKHSNGDYNWVLDKGKVTEFGINGQPLIIQGVRINIELTGQDTNPFDYPKKDYKSLMHNIPGTFYQALFDNRRTFFFLSESIQEITGFSNDEFLNQNISFQDLIHPQDRDKVFDIIELSISNNNYWEIEYRIFNKNNEIVWLYERGKFTHEKYNDKYIIDGFIMNITDKKESEIEFLRTKEILDKTNEVAQIGSWEINYETNKIYWSSITKNIHEVALNFQITIENVYSFFKKDNSYLKAKSLFDDAIINGLPFDTELEIVTAKGLEKWVRITAQPEFVQGKVKRLFGSIQDITKRKRDSIKILKQNKFRELVAIISSNFVKSNLREISELMNDTLKKCIDYFSADRSFIFQINNQEGTISNTFDQRIEGVADFQHRVQKRSLNDFPWFSSLILKKEVFTILDVDDLPESAIKEKTEWQLQGIKSILFLKFDINNKPAGVIGLASHTKKFYWNLEDINDLKVISNIVSDALSRYQLELNLIKEKLKADKANNAKSEFLASMSHEIRTPLNAILGFSEILFNRSTNASDKKQLAIILNSGKSLLNLINDLLDISKIESGNLSLNSEMLELKQMLFKIEQMFSELAKENNVKLEFQIENNIPDFIYIDPIRLQQILVNLIGNALKFTKNGNVNVIISFNENLLIQNEGVLYFNISDTGIGISENSLSKIFESFHQGTDMISKEFGGTGLGLTITKKLLDLMNGNIEVESKLGEGSIFKIEMPIKEYYYEKDALQFDSNSDQQLVFKSGEILVIDDVEINNELIKAYLKDHNVSVKSCNNGIDSLPLLQSMKPDIVLIDLRMPGLSGSETAERIKSTSIGKDIPLIAFTASLTKDETFGGLFSATLNKPVIEEELFSVLKKFLPYEEA
ncbi:PAS domain-containing protein [Marivirga arenosa]|uniref:histidine kinase n=1 Tax=Marivirga arenosa TaxID=3059076 RepID=A0AA51ZXK4_9BACT|nr:PAS domain-containing protein [Marivirga sp. BKB1-2]WNB18583.1 PAS domain-containing protein [Marivirga sp. BKB1-2]